MMTPSSSGTDIKLMLLADMYFALTVRNLCGKIRRAWKERLLLSLCLSVFTCCCIQMRPAPFAYSLCACVLWPYTAFYST